MTLILALETDQIPHPAHSQSHVIETAPPTLPTDDMATLKGLPSYVDHAVIHGVAVLDEAALAMQPQDTTRPAA